MSSLAGFNLKRFTFSGGIYVNSLLRSTTVIHDDKINDFSGINGYTGYNLKRVKNPYYSQFNIGMSLMAVYNFNRMSINLKYNRGLTDKVSSSNNLVKEYDRSVILGIWIYFN